MVHKILVVFGILTLVLAVSWSFFRPGLFRVHDFVHAARISEYARAVEDGHFPVRWSENFGYGFGMPLFEFYAPLPYAVGAFLWRLGIPMALTIKLLFAFSSLAIAIGTYLLVKTLYGILPGLLAASMVTLAPYRAVNIFVRGALSESWAMSCMPFILLGITLTVQRKKEAKILLILSLSALILSHNLSVLLFFPAAIFFALVLIVYRIIGNNEKIKAQRLIVADLSFSFVASVLITAYYWVPAFTEKDFTKVDETILGGYFDYSLHFLYLRQFLLPYWGYGGSEWGPNDGMSFFLGIGSLVAITFSIYLLIKMLLSRQKLKEYFLSLNWFGIAGILLFMTTFKSSVLWNAHELFSYFQFPWRFLSPFTIFMALATASVVAKIKNRLVLSAIVLFCIFVQIITQAMYFKPESMLQNSDDLYYTDAERIQNSMSSILPDYIPKTLLLTTPPSSLVLNEAIEYQMKVDRVHEKLFTVNSDIDQLITVSIAAYPGWKTYLNGEEVAHAVSKDGLIEVLVPKGVQTVGIQFDSTPIRRISDTVSFLTIWILAGLLFYQQLSTQRKNNE